MLSQPIRIFVLFVSVGILTYAGYCEFYRRVDAAALQGQHSYSLDKAADEFAKNAKQTTTKADFGNLPLYFAANRGQAADDVKFYSAGSRYSLFLTESGATMRVVTKNAGDSETNNLGRFEKPENFKTDDVNLTFVGGDFSELPAGEEELSGKVNYLVGSDTSKWQTNLSTFAKVRYKNIYSGIDALFYGNQHELEYDFVIAPHANPNQIKLAFDAAKKVDVNRGGELVVKLQNGAEISQRRPVAYQIIDGKRREVTARFVKQGTDRIAFRLGKYDVEKELVIDPIIIFSTYFGGSNSETATAVKTDAEGNIYLTGSTASANFPILNPAQATYGGNYSNDAYVTKINPAGNSIIYSTYLGGSSEDSASSLNIDADGNAIVTGRTYSLDFPNVNASQKQIAGSADGFIAKLNPSGSALLYSSFLGGAAFDEILGAALDGDGNTVVVGRTDSGDFPTVNPFQAAQAGTPFFRSVNSGASWSNGIIAPGVSTIYSFALNARSPNTVFAATNTGVFRSNDGGTTWLAAGHSDLGSPVAKIAVSRSNPNIVYAVSNGGIYKSSNGGDNWTSIQGNLYFLFNTIAVDTTDSETVYVGGSGGSIYKTTDGGMTWASFSIVNVSANVNSLAIDPSNAQNIYVGTTQRIYKSVTGGGNWTVIANGLPSSTTYWDLLFDSTKNTLFTATQNGLFKTVDGGANWTQITANNLTTAVRSIVQDPNNPAIFYAATGFGSVFRSLDGGTSWSQSSTLSSGNGFYAVGSTSNSILVGGYGGTDAFIARIGNDGRLNYSTFFGGSLNDSATGVRVDASGKITFVGTTSSADLPTANAVQSVFGGANDAFAAKLNADGKSLVYSTFLGGASSDSAAGVAIDSAGNAYIAGTTISADFPVQNALQAACASCANFYNDAFVTKLSATGNRVYSTFLGGIFSENATAIEVDSQNRAIVTGSTSSNNFPVLDAVQPAIAGGTDAFVSQIKADGSNFIYSTYFGGSSTDSISGVTIAPEGNAVIVGQTSSYNLPTVRAIQNTSGGSQDAFIAKIGVAADLEIVNTDERDPVMVNNPLVYDWRVKNNGLSPATGVVVTDVLPSGVNFVSVTPTQGTCAASGSTVTCNLGNLASGAQINIRLIATPTQVGTINNTATVRGNEPDPVSANNSDSEQTKISDLPSIFGKVSSGGDGQAASAVAITVEGFENRATQTDVNGEYAFKELPLAGNYTVRPEKTGFYFSPRSRSYNSLTRDETADFVINACTYTLSSTMANFSAGGGSQIIFITANDPFCAWTATSNAPWISITSDASGYGSGSVKIAVQTSGVSRTGTLTIGGQTFTVTQGGCSFSLMPFQQSFGQNGGTGTIAVTASQNFCQWTATPSDSSWITVTGASSGTGSGTINYTVAPAGANPRGGRIIVAGQAFPIWQESNFCPTPSFAAPVEAPVNSESTDIINADFNSDGIPDLATIDVTPTQSSTFTVYIGKSDGTTDRNTQPSPIGPLTSIVAGDFNRDSKIDIAIAGSGKIAVYNGNGSGGFSFFKSFDAVSGKVFVEDFNRDGKLDFLVGVGNGMYLYNGNGDGTFTAGANYQVAGRYSYSYAVGDLNGDGVTDVVIGNDENFNLPRLIYYFGSKDGTFSIGGTITLGKITPFNLKIADFNGDGRADVVTDGAGASQLRVFLWNPATNTFRSPIKVFTEPFTAYRFDVADINNDGKPDIVSASNQDYPQRVNIMRGNGNGTFLSPIGFASVKSVNAMTFADFNRDGRIDLVFAKKVNQIAVQLNQCNSATTAEAAADYTKNRAKIFDFDGDGKADFSVVRPTDNTWYIFNSADKSLTARQFGTNGDVSVPADYDGDGRTDVAVFRPAEGVWYRFNSSDDSFAAEQWGKAGDIPVPADYDGDERADLAVFRPENKTWYWLGSLNGQINSAQFGLSGDVPVVGDYDGDGKADIAVFRPSNNFWYWLNSSDGKFQSLQFGLSKDKPLPADYDGDGKTDIAVFRPSTNVWHIMKSSDNQFLSVKFGAKGDVPAPADYDGDGKTDIAVFRYGSWFTLESSSNKTTGAQFGVATDKPLPSR